MGEDELSEEVVRWLEKLHLSQYMEKAKAWCNDSGAVSVSEIHENFEDFAEKLQLKKLERKRVEKEIQVENSGGSPSSKPSSVSPPTSVPAVPPQGPSSPSHAAPAVTSPGGFGSGSMTIGPPENPQKYILGKALGQGATATVYECRCGTETYAVKTISLAKLRLQPGFQRIADKMRREVSILFSLKHPRIVSLHDVVEEPDPTNPTKLHLVLDLVPGGELFDRIVNEGSFTEPSSRYVFAQITEGLKYIHSKDIVYRDLKPENILVDERSSNIAKGLYEIKLSDFGHSKTINDGYSTALTRVGTPQYWAPEVSDAAMAARGYDQKVDLWSLGVVLYVMLIGGYPFNGQDGSVETQIQKAQIEFRRSARGTDISEPAKSLVRSLIKVVPMDRLPLDKCLSHEWVTSSGDINPNRLMKLETEINPRVIEERFRLPMKPTKEQIEILRRDLHTWMTKFHCFAKVAHDEIIVSLGDESQVAPDVLSRARQELQQLVTYHCGGVAPSRPPPQARSSGYGSVPLESVPESGAGGGKGGGRPTFRIITANLKVHPEQGAGLDLQPERGGMRIAGIQRFPGQPFLKTGDLIVKINEVKLFGTEDQVEDKFGSNFGDGAQLSVKRFS